MQQSTKGSMETTLIERLEAGEEVGCYVTNYHTALYGDADYNKGKTALITRYEPLGVYPYRGNAPGEVYRYAKPIEPTMEDYREALEQHHSFSICFGDLGDVIDSGVALQPLTVDNRGFDTTPEAPTHTASGLPTDAKERKAIPVYTGFINYFPKAIAAVAKISLVGGIQHGQTAETLHWDRSKSGDELDAMMRHILDGDWEQVAWRAMANLEKKLEEK